MFVPLIDGLGWPVHTLAGLFPPGRISAGALSNVTEPFQAPEPLLVTTSVVDRNWLLDGSMIAMLLSELLTDAVPATGTATGVDA